MSEPFVASPGDESRALGADLPATPVCAVCHVSLGEPFGWCENCRKAFCVACGSAHFCLPSCAAAGCRAGLCVRLVRGGVVVRDSWGMRE